MKIKLYCSFILLLTSNYISAEIIISPNSPQSNQNVTISLVLQYGSAAGVTETTITRNGNRFDINQTVEVACFLPSAPTLTSVFDVGLLERGEYQVTAQILNTSSLDGCPPDSTITQSDSFGVAGPVSVPVGGAYLIFLLIGLLTLIGVLQIKNMRSSKQI